MAWVILFLAGLCEVTWAIGMKYADGFTRLTPSIVTIVFMAASAGLLSLAVRSLPIGTAYAVWTGIGAAGAALLGVCLFDEPTAVPRLASIGLIIAGIIGLKLTS